MAAAAETRLLQLIHPPAVPAHAAHRAAAALHAASALPLPQLIPCDFIARSPQLLILSIAAAMSYKCMRPIVKQEPGEEGAGTELEVQLLRANAEAQAFALQGMERERAMAEQLLQAKEEQLQRERAMGEELKAMGEELKARGEQLLQSKEQLLQAKEVLLQACLPGLSGWPFIVCAVPASHRHFCRGRPTERKNC
jgi:hypothetical protein